MSTDSLCSATCVLKKVTGTLTLYASRELVWQPGSGSGFTVQGSQISGLFASKPDSAKVMLKVQLEPTQPGETPQTFNFTFLSASSAISDREHFKNGLSEIVAFYRSQPVVTQQPVVSEKAKGKRKATSPAPGDDRSLAFDTSLRIKVLMTNPDLRGLHEALVVTGQITEHEFWSTPGRDALLAEQYASDHQQVGRSAQLADATKEYGEGGEIRMKITPQLIADIFAQYPIVQRAYDDNVPPLKEQEFWQRFFSSKLYNQVKASSRKAGDTIKDDAILDKYLEIEDDSGEAPDVDVETISRLLDLAATQEDHGETGNERDFTMRAGGNKAALPLMRRFNQHSERMLDRSLGKQAASTGTHDAAQRNYENDILLDDLQPARASNRIALDMEDEPQRFYENAPRDSEQESGLSPEEVEELVIGLKTDMLAFEPDLGNFQADQDAVDHAFENITSLSNARRQAKLTKSQTFPERTLQSMTTCLATSNEFLRQFWSAVLPPRPGDISYEAGASPKERAARAKKMIGYLGRTQERVDSLVGSAAREHAERIRFALKPMVDAVQHALTYYNDRLKP